MGSAPDDEKQTVQQQSHSTAKKLQARRRFQKNIRQHISAAQNGSLEDLNAIYSYNPSTLPPTVQPVVVRMVRKILALPCPEDYDALETRNVLYTYDRICKCFQIIRRLHYSYFKLQNFAELRLLWPDSVRWMTHFHAHTTLYGKDRRYHYTSGLSAVLSDQLEASPQGPDALLEDEMFELAARAWADPDLPLEASEAASIAISALGPRKDSSQGVFLSLFHHSDELAALTLCRLRRSLKAEPLECARVAAHIGVISAFLALAFGKEVRAAFFNAGVTRRIVKLLVNFAERGKTEKICCSCHIAACIHVLGTIHYGIRSEVIPLASHALHHQMLQALLRVGLVFSQFQNRARSAFEKLVINCIPRLMCFRAYSSRFLQAMDAVEGGASAEYEFQKTPAPFQSMWASLTSYALEVAVLRKLNAVGLQEQKVWCDEPHCDISDKMTALKRCGGCRTAVYCSKACQSKAWNAGHREQCSKIAKDIGFDYSHQYATSSTASYDKSLVIQVACATVKRHLKSILRIAGEKYPGRPMEKIMLYIDLQRRPHNISLHPIYAGSESTCERQHFHYFFDKVLRRVERGCKRVLPLSIGCASDWTSEGDDLLVMSDIDVNANLDGLRVGTDSGTDSRILRRRGRDSALYHEGQKLDAEYDVVDAVLDTMHASGRQQSLFKEASIQEAIEVYFELPGVKDGVKDTVDGEDNAVTEV